VKENRKVLLPDFPVGLTRAIMNMDIIQPLLNDEWILTVWWRFGPIGGVLFGLLSYHVRAVGLPPEQGMTSSLFDIVVAAGLGWPSRRCSLDCYNCWDGRPAPIFLCFLQSIIDDKAKVIYEIHTHKHSKNGEITKNKENHK
jgi:hypothetical protein